MIESNKKVERRKIMADEQIHSLDALTVVPLYRQLKHLIEEEINTGRWKPGDKIPAEPELSSRFGVSRITVRAALNELSEEGLLVKIQGKGTFVTNRKSKKLLTIDISSFSEFCRQNNMKPQRRMLFKAKEKADEADTELLGLPSGSDIIHIARVLYADDVPLIIADDRIIDEYAYLLNEDLENGSLNAKMLGSGISKLSSISRTVEVCTATATEAEQLSIKIGAPLLLIRDITADETGRAVRRTKELIVGDKVRISYHSQF